jgi:hypothetical protein
MLPPSNMASGERPRYEEGVGQHDGVPATDGVRGPASDEDGGKHEHVHGRPEQHLVCSSVSPRSSRTRTAPRRSSTQDLQVDKKGKKHGRPDAIVMTDERRSTYVHASP